MYALDLDAEPSLLSTERPATRVDPLSYVSLRHCGTITGPGPERFRVLGLAAPGRWSATRLESDRLTANFQGNPLWPVEILAEYPDLGELFGLRRSSSQSALIVPMAATINARVAELFGPAGRRFHFRAIEDYRSFDGVNISTVDYVDTFIDTGAFPMSPIATKDSMHDWSYHFMTLLFPAYAGGIQATLAHIRAELGELAEPVTRTWNYFGHTVDAAGNFQADLRVEAMPHRDAVYRQMAITLDSATAKPIQLLLLRRRGLLDRYAAELRAASVFLAGVTEASIQRVLFLERPQTLVEAPSSPGPAGAEPDVIAAMVAQLDELEGRAADLVDHEAVSARAAAFTDCLARVEALLHG